MYAYTILIPTNLNDGSVVSAAKINSLRVRMLDTFGGYTHNPTPLNGAWRDDDGTVYHDTLNAYTLFSADASAIERMARDVAVALQQICVSVIGPDGSATLVYQDVAAHAA